MTSIRRLGALTLAVPLAVGITAFGPDAAAQAAGSSIKSPAAGAVITSGSTTTVTAHLDLLATGTLYVRSASGSDQKIASGIGPTDISGTVSTSRNGAYVATLKGLLGTIDKQTYYVRVPPARPAGVDVGVSERKLVVRWDRGGESDLTGYDVYEGGTRVRRGSLGALCSDQVCSTALSLPASGGRATVGVRARRSNGTGGTVTSGLSTASVVLPSTLALSAAGRAPGTLPSQSTQPLLPLPGKSPLSLPTVAPNGEAPGFQYPAPGPQVANPASSASAANTSSVSPLRWAKSLALALILLVVAAHLGAWTRRLRLAQAPPMKPATAGALALRRKHDNQPDGPDRDADAGTPESPPAPAKEPAIAAATRQPATVGSADERGPSDRRTGRPASGRLIDAKGTVLDAAALLATGGSPARSAPEPPDDDPRSTVVAATARARTATQDGKAHGQHSKAGRSNARHAAGYRGRRRAD